MGISGVGNFVVIVSEGQAQDFIQILICSGKEFLTQIFQGRPSPAHMNYFPEGTWQKTDKY